MENFKKLGIGLTLLVMLSIITVILGYFSFDIAYPEYSFFRKLYLSFQLFTTESGDKFYDSETAYTFSGRLIFNLARFLAILTLIYTVVLALLTILKERFYLTQVKRMHGHTILCGLGEIGTSIAQNFEVKNKLVIIERDISNEKLDNLKKQGVKVINGNALDPEVLKKAAISHAACLHALTGDDFSNLTIIAHAKSILPVTAKVLLNANIDSRNLKVATNQEMVCFPKRQKCELRKDLDKLGALAVHQRNFESQDKVPDQIRNEFDEIKNKLLDYDPDCHADPASEGDYTRLFNINELAAWYIFRKYPPDLFKPVLSKNDDPVHILILGFSQMGEELLKLCIQNCHFINHKNSQITLLGLDIQLHQNKILSKRKDIHKMIELKFIELNPHHITPECLSENKLDRVDIIYICSGSDRTQASYSIKAFEVFGNKVPIVRWFTKDVMSGITLEKPRNMHTVEIFTAVANHESITNNNIDKIAIAIHHRWLKRAIKDYIKKVEKLMFTKEEIPEPKDTLLPWHLLDEEIRDDNRSVVEHNFIKFRSVGQFTNPDFFLNPEKTDIDFGFLENEEKVQELAEMEHRRWMATKYYYAWRYNIERYDPKKIHNNLIDFNRLDAGTKAYDIEQINELKQIWELIKNISKNGKPKTGK